MKIRRANRFGIPLLLGAAGWALCLFVSRDVGADDAPIKIRVINHSTHASVTGAKVSVQEGNGVFKELGVTSNGILQFTPANPAGKFEFHVEANGYVDRNTSVLPEKGVAEIDLYPTKFWVKGIVLGAGGQAASDAQLAFAVGRMPVALVANRRLRNGETEPLHLQTSNSLTNSAVTEKNGVFGAMARPETSSIIAVHPLGCAAISITDWTNGMTMKLRPWTSLRGRMVINGQPAANKDLVAVRCDFFESGGRLYLRNFETTTDAEGRFVFDRLPAWVIDIAQKVSIAGRLMYSHGRTFVADASFPASEVIYELKGRDITGTVMLETNKRVDWAGFNVFATLVADAAETIDEFTPLDAQGPRPRAGSLAIAINGDGEFSAATIPAGAYTLNVNCFDRFNPAVAVKGKLLVPAGDGPIGIGPIVVKNMPLRNLRLAE